MTSSRRGHLVDTRRLGSGRSPFWRFLFLLRLFTSVGVLLTGLVFLLLTGP